MARARIRGRGSGVDLDLELEGFDRTAREFREVRRKIARQLDEVERDTAERVVLPGVRQAAGGLNIDNQSIASRLVVRRSRGGPQVTTTFRGIRGRAVGLLEFGGTVRTPLVPRRAKALLVNGEPRAIVRKARVYRARKFIQQGIDDRLGRYGEEVRDAIVDFFTTPPFDRG